jgi:glutathione synthase/RimK-type ligase-like ATP-grasp enzyme
VVLGVGHGHDAAGILAALQPVARRVLLTSSGHPKALDPAALAGAAPAGMPVDVMADCRAAFSRALADLPPDGCMCVAGSLYLVARAREFLDLPMVRDGITEDMALESLACVEQACRQLGVAWEAVSADGNVVRVHRGGRSLHFLRNKNPFNDYVAGRLAEDKGYQYELFSRAAIPVPDTLQVFNPLADSRFDRYRTHASVDDIVGAAQSRFTFPVVVKKCHSSLAQGVYLEASAATLRRRLQELFENSGFLDNVVLVQQFVSGSEYRIVASRNQLLLAYAKVSDAGGALHDLNPLHQADGRAVRVDDSGLLERLRTLTAKVAGVLELGFYAIDLIDGPAGLHVLEINPNPFCFFYNRTNGRDDFVRIYATLLERLLPPA